MAGGLAERECTSLRKGLAGEGARFSLFFSNWWFCGLVSLPEPLELSIIHRHRQQQGGDEGSDQSTAPRKISDMRHQKNSQLSSLPSSSSGWGCASCVGLRCFTPSRLHSPGCHCSPLWRKHRNKKNNTFKKKKKQNGGITGTDGMTDRLHLQTGLVRLKLGRKESAPLFLRGSGLHPSVSPGVSVGAPVSRTPLPTPSYLTCKICNRCGARLDARDFLRGACAAASEAPKHTPCFLWDQV